MKEALIAELHKTSEELFRAIELFKQEEVNTIPFEGSWTPGQVIEHIDKSVFAGLLFGKTKPSERNPAEKIETIKNIFLNFSIKMKNPDFNTPVNSVNYIDQLSAKLKTKMEELGKIAAEEDLTLLCLDLS